MNSLIITTIHRRSALLSPLYKWESWGTERLSNLPKFTQTRPPGRLILELLRLTTCYAVTPEKASPTVKLLQVTNPGTLGKVWRSSLPVPSNRDFLCMDKPYTLTHTHTHIFSCLHTHPHVASYLHTHSHTYSHTCSHTQAHKSCFLTPLHSYTQMHSHTYILTHLHIHAFSHMHTHTHTLTHTIMAFSSSSLTYPLCCLEQPRTLHPGSHRLLSGPLSLAPS